jgi:hypothetical protein
MSAAPVGLQPAVPGDAQLQLWYQSGIATSEQLADFSCAWARKYLQRMVEGPIHLDELIGALSGPTHQQGEVIGLDYAGLLWRKGQVGIYGSEVVIIRVEEGRHKFGRWYPTHEKYPSSEDWGTYGWTYTRNSHTDPWAAAIARTIAASQRLAHNRKMEPRADN